MTFFDIFKDESIKYQPSVYKPSKQGYTVGFDIDTQMTNLTITANNGTSMTLSLSDTETQRLIRLLKTANLNDDADE